MVGHSPEMQEGFRYNHARRPHRATVAVRGERRVGKDLIARARIHHHSLAPIYPFVTINLHCAAGKISWRANCSATKRARSREPHIQTRQIRTGRYRTVFLDEIGECRNDPGQTSAHLQEVSSSGW